MQQPLTLLLVEDNPGDVRLMQEMLKETGVAATLHVARDGVHALTYLRATDGEMPDRRPQLILLDWYLPRKNGGEVLAELDGDPTLKEIPVAVLTTSDDEETVFSATGVRADAYIPKPGDPLAFADIAQRIQAIAGRVALA